MGCTYSGSFMDAVLCELESDALPCASEHSVIGYWRFKDDALIHSCNRWGSRGWCANYKSIVGRIFDLEFVLVSAKKVDFLSVEVGIANGVLFTRSKPLAPSRIPLACNSAHPRHVLTAWPVSDCVRRINLCTRKCDKLNTKSEYIDYMSKTLGDNDVMAKLTSIQITRSPATLRRVRPTLWLPLPFHPLWAAAGLPKQIRFFLSDPRAKSVWMDALENDDPPDVRIAWANVLPTLTALWNRTWR